MKLSKRREGLLKLSGKALKQKLKQDLKTDDLKRELSDLVVKLLKNKKEQL